MKKKLKVGVLEDDFLSALGSVIPKGTPLTILRVKDYRGEPHAVVREYGYYIPLKFIKIKEKRRRR